MTSLFSEKHSCSISEQGDVSMFQNWEHRVSFILRRPNVPKTCLSWFPVSSHSVCTDNPSEILPGPDWVCTQTGPKQTSPRDATYAWTSCMANQVCTSCDTHHTRIWALCSGLIGITPHLRMVGITPQDWWASHPVQPWLDCQFSMVGITPVEDSSDLFGFTPSRSLAQFQWGFQYTPHGN